MTSLPIFLVVLAALIHATWNLLAKRVAAAGAVVVLVYSLVACIAYAPWLVYVLIHDGLAWSVGGCAFVLLGSILHLGYSLCLQRAYHVADLSVVYPVARGTGPTLSTIGAALILGETLTLGRLAGLALVVLGIVLIATRGDLSAFHSADAHRGVRWGTGTGALIASYTVVDAIAVKSYGIAPVALDWVSNAFRCCTLAPILLREPGKALAAMRGHWRDAVLVGLLSPLSYILVLTALSMGTPLSIVAPMREMSMMVGALMGMILLKETVGPWRLAGCALVIGGVVFLAT